MENDGKGEMVVWWKDVVVVEEGYGTIGGEIVVEG